MSRARNLFLEEGWYAPLAKKVAEIATSIFLQNGIVVDAGCGEGYYTLQIYRGLVEAGLSPAVYGFDLSKFSLKYASRRLREEERENCGFFVSSIFSLPLPNRSVNLVADIFAPVADREFFRVLKKGGYLLLAVPGARHLWGLKEAVYEAPYENEVKVPEYPGFRFVRKEEVNYEVEINSAEQIFSLFRMTPYYFKTSREGSERAQKLTKLHTPVQFILYLLQKQ